MADIAGKCGFVVMAAVSAVAEHSIMRQFAAGRPDKSDARQLKSFAKMIQERLKAGAPEGGVRTLGKQMYKRAGAGLVPKATKDCTGCGLCAKQCPAQAISPENIRNTDPRKCISCMRCITECPHSARKVNSAMVAIASLLIKKECAIRKECELFF